MAERRVRSLLKTPSRRFVLGGMATGLALPGVAQAMQDDDWTAFDDSFGLISFKGEVNGRPVTMTLDSGAGRVVIDHAFARSIGLEPAGPAGTIHGLAESRPGGLSGPVEIKIGSGILTLPNTVLADLSALAATGYDAPILIGRDIFELVAVDIDFAGKRIAFRDRKAFDPRGFRRYPMRPRADLRQVQISIEGNRTTWGIIDLGSASALAMSQAYASTVGLLDGRPVSAWVSSGIDGITSYRVATARQVQFAGTRLDLVPFDVLPVWNRANTAQINIGYPLMNRLGRIVMDYRGDSLYVAATAPRPQPFTKNRIGLALIALERGYRVAYVAPNGPGERQGWRRDEIIAAINGDPSMPGPARSALNNAASITFTMADGSTRRLVPADYY